MKKKLLVGLLVLGLLASAILPFTQVSATEPIDTSLSSTSNELTPASAPWDWQMLGAFYHIRVKEDFTAGQILGFEVEGSTVQLQPMALEWTNDIDQIQQVSMPQNTTPTITNPGHQGTITWDNAYGSGIDFEWQCAPIRLYKTLTVNKLSDLPSPYQYIQDGGNPVLRLNLIFDPSSDVDIYVNDQLWDKSSKQQTFDIIEFRKDGEVLWNFMPLIYWDSVGSEGQSVATLEKRGTSLYISIRVPYEWLQSAVYPVFIDADVLIESTVCGFHNKVGIRGGIFWTSPTVGYVIYVDFYYDLLYRKTVDGGVNWAAAVPIAAAGSCYASSYNCWADWQTAGDAGTKIHIAYISMDLNEVRYVYLDISDDSVGGDDLIETCQGTGTLNTTVGLYYAMVSITKTRGGNLAVAIKYLDNSYAPFNSFYTSPDATTWTSKTSPYADEGGTDYCLLFPGNEADDQDVWGVYWDATADEISLKTYDDSGNSWSEQSISLNMTENTTYLQMDGVIRLSDGHLILAAWNLYNNAASDLMVWDINGAGSITSKTNVLTNIAEYALCSIFTNQNTDDIYVAYAGGTDFTTLVKVFYQKSADGGGSWGGQAAMQANAEDNERWISCGAVKTAWGGKFQPVWFNDDLDDIFTNVTNGISIAAAGPPTVTTSATTLVEETTATLVGEITAVGGANATARGFEWDIDTGAPYAFSWEGEGDFGVGEFTRAITGLTKGELYYYRAYATNPSGTGYGGEVTFLTKPDAPNTLDAVAAADADIDLTWVNGAGSDTTYIVRKDGSYPANRADGTNVYNGALELYHDDDVGLVIGHTYYYRAWSWCTEGGKEQFSDLYSQDSVILTLGLALWYQPETIISGTVLIDRQDAFNGVITWGGRLADSGSAMTLTDSELTQVDDYWNGYTLKIKEVAGDAAPEGEESEITDFTSATLGGTADSGSTTTLVDAVLTQTTAYWAGATVTIVTTTDGEAPQGESKVVTTWDLPTSTLTFPAMTAVVDTGDTYTLTAADTLFFGAFTATVGAGNRYEIWDGQTILWGSFPAGIKVAVGALTAYTDPVSSAVGLEAPEVAGLPPEPGGMWGGAATEDLPLYELFNTVATNLGWTADVLYVVAWFILSIGLGVALLITTGSGLGAIAGVGAGMVGGMATGMLPVWVLLVYLVLAGTWLYTSRAM